MCTGAALFLKFWTEHPVVWKPSCPVVSTPVLQGLRSLRVTASDPHSMKVCRKIQREEGKRETRRVGGLDTVIIPGRRGRGEEVRE